MKMEKPEIEVIEFEQDDVIVDSGCPMDCPDDCGIVCANKCQYVG